MKVYFVTCDEIPEGIEDDQYLSKRLEERGYTVETKVWKDPSVVWAEADVVILRTTWDYHRHLDAFLHWAEQVEQVTMLVHPHRLVRWNASKRYLLELQQAGVSIIPSHITNDLHQAEQYSRKLLHDYNQIILKPTVSGSAELTFLVDSTTQSVEESLKKILTQSEVIIQPFIQSVQVDGEVSLMFVSINHKPYFTHAIIKNAKIGDFRVQTDYGGSVQSFEASQDLQNFALNVLSKLTYPFLYARVDIIDWKTSPTLGELELIEPEMFFRMSPTHSVNLFVDALEAWMRDHKKS